MSLSEYKSPVVKKPKFGWQRYQFGNKSAAELKTSLWDANLSEVVVPNVGITPVFPFNLLDWELFHSIPSKGKTNHAGTMKVIKPISSINELVKFLNSTLSFYGEFRPTPTNDNVYLVVDSTWARIIQGDESGTWKLTVNCN